MKLYIGSQDLWNVVEKGVGAPEEDKTQLTDVHRNLLKNKKTEILESSLPNTLGNRNPSIREGVQGNKCTRVMGYSPNNLLWPRSVQFYLRETDNYVGP